MLLPINAEQTLQEIQTVILDLGPKVGTLEGNKWQKKPDGRLLLQTVVSVDVSLSQ